MATRRPETDLRTRLGRACAELESRLRAGEAASAEDYFANDPALGSDADTALELIYAEYVTRDQLGAILDSEEWFARFPNWEQDLRELFQIHALMEEGLEQRLSPIAAEADSAAILRGLLPAEYPCRLGHFELLAEVGRGASGLAFKAKDLNLGRLVALKMIRPGTGDEGDLHRFRAEAEAVARLQHPNIVQIYEISEVAGRPFLSLEFIEGGSLKEAMERGPRPPSEAAALVEVIARAVAYAHRRGVVHRDLKPANVLLTTDRVPKVVDFSLAKLVSREHPSPEPGDPGHRAAILGTIGYMAPEQFGSAFKQDGLAADLYSLGAILYELLTGHPPCGVESYFENLARGFALDPPPPSQHRKSIPLDLDAITMRCLHTDPALRYPDAEALADDLRRFLAGEPVQARPLSVWTRGSKWAKRRPAAAALAAVSVLAVVGLLVGSIWYNARLSDLAHRAERLRGEAERQARLLADQLEFSRRSLYALQLTHVQGALQSNPGLGVHLLNDTNYCPPDLRDFTWNYDLRLGKRKRIDLRHPRFGAVNAVAFSPDGRTLAVAGSPAGQPADLPGQVKLFEWEGPGRELRKFGEESGTIYAIAFSPDGKTLVTGGGRTGDPTSRAGSARLWDLASGQQRRTLEGQTEPIYAVAFSPDGQVLATAGGDSNVRLWDPRDGRLMTVLHGHDGAVRTVAFAPNGQVLATGGEDGTVRLWNLNQGRECRVLKGHKGPIHALAFSIEGRRLVSAGADKTAILWELTANHPQTVFRGHLAAVLTVGFSRDGATVITGGEECIVRFWRTDDGRELTALNIHNAPVTSIALHPGGGIFASGSLDRTAKVWDLNPGRQPPPLRGHEAKVTAALVAPDNTTLFTAGRDRTIKRWDLTQGRVTETLRNEAGSVECLALSSGPGRHLLASGGDDNLVRLWACSTGRGSLLRALPGHSNRVTAVALAPGGQTLASASLDSTARLWDPTTGLCRSILKAHSGGIHGVAFSNDGRVLATAGEDWLVKLWNVADGQELATLRGHTLGVISLAFHPDGKTLATGSKDRTIKFWDLKTRQEKLTLWGHNHWVGQIVFSPDARTMASSTGDPGPNAVGEVKLWDAVTGHVRATFQGQTTPLAFTPDGQTLLTGNHDKTLNRLDSEPDPLIP